MGLVRLLSIPKGADKDAEGRGFGDDWQLLDLGQSEDGTRHYLTTDCVRASEFACIPGFHDPAEMGAWLVEQINAAKRDEWPHVIPERPVMPPSDAWFSLNGKEWATNGHILVTRATAIPAVDWRRGDRRPDAEGVAGVVASTALGVGLDAADFRDRLGVDRVYSVLDWTTAVDMKYAGLLDLGKPRQAGHRQPIGVFVNGEAVAVVMPLAD